jgi:hypothetical protein
MEDSGQEELQCEINTGEYMEGTGTFMYLQDSISLRRKMSPAPCRYNFTFSVCYFAEELSDHRWNRLTCITSSTWMHRIKDLNVLVLM